MVQRMIIQSLTLCAALMCISTTASAQLGVPQVNPDVSIVDDRKSFRPNGESIMIRHPFDYSSGLFNETHIGTVRDFTQIWHPAGSVALVTVAGVFLLILAYSFLSKKILPGCTGVVARRA